MSERDDDGQALTAVLSDTGPAFPGTLRDWFAGQALVGMAPVVCKPGCQYEPQEGDPRSVEEFTAAVVYSLADAMLAERAKDMPTGAAEYDPARLGEMERGQAPDEPAAAGRNDSAAKPAPAHVPHCLNCGLVLGSDRPYCDVCGCLATTHGGRLQCTKAKGHVLHHLNGCDTWYGDLA